MSQENVEIVKAVHPPSGSNVRDLFTNEDEASRLVETLAPLVTPDFEVVGGDTRQGGLSLTASGVEGLVEAWREWLEPWEEYRTEVEDLVDTGEGQVLVLVRDFGRPRGSDAVIELAGASVWTFRDGRIARIEFHPSRERALEAAGLRD